LQDQSLTMPYDRMIQIVDITAKLVGNALSQR
jgi:transcriptional regulator of heat shock response